MLRPAGRLSSARVSGPGSPPATRGNFSPAVGGASRTGLFVNPLTGRAKYTKTVYDPTLRWFGTHSTGGTAGIEPTSSN